MLARSWLFSYLENEAKTGAFYTWCGFAAGPDGELPEALQKLDPNILELVCNEILDKQSGIAWDDIAGQHDAKSLVQELVVWPMLNPHLFTVRSPVLQRLNPESYYQFFS